MGNALARILLAFLWLLALADARAAIRVAASARLPDWDAAKLVPAQLWRGLPFGSPGFREPGSAEAGAGEATQHSAAGRYESQ